MNFSMPSFSGMAGGLQGFEAPMTRAEARGWEVKSRPYQDMSNDAIFHW